MRLSIGGPDPAPWKQVDDFTLPPRAAKREEMTMKTAQKSWSMVAAGGETIASGLSCWEDVLDKALAAFDGQFVDWQRPRGQSLVAWEFFDVRTNVVVAEVFCDYE